MDKPTIETTESTPDNLLSKHVRQQGLHLVQVSGEGKGRALQIAYGETVIGTSAECTVQVADKSVSRRHCRIERSDNALRITDLKSTNGTLVDGVAVDAAYLRAGSTIRVGTTTFAIDIGYAPLPVDTEPSMVGFRGMVGASPQMRAVFGARTQLTGSDATVLIQGETGTGKSALARSIHQASKRQDQPFVVFDCAAVSPTLIESELFGHEKGAFTGADKVRIGAIEMAGEGALFIDELSELPLDLQPKLLRALEEREFKRLGSTSARPVKCRIIAASQHDVWALAESGKFRKDLYFRVAVVVVPMPPLRERKEDLKAIVDHLLNVMEAPVMSFAQLPDQVRQQILSHDWPGNVRELRNYLERYVVTQSASLPASRPQPVAETEASQSFDFSVPFRDSKQAQIDSYEKRYLTALLRHTNHNLGEAAKVSGINRRHLTDLLLRHGLDRASLAMAATGRNES